MDDDKIIINRIRILIRKVAALDKRIADCNFEIEIAENIVSDYADGERLIRNSKDKYIEEIVRIEEDISSEIDEEEDE